jgi:hypothetical protein
MYPVAPVRKIVAIRLHIRLGPGFRMAAAEISELSNCSAGMIVI